MFLKLINHEWLQDYRKPSMFIAFPSCSFKCERECGLNCCHNGALAQTEDISVPSYEIVKAYMANPLTSALVCGGLEPFDSWYDLIELVARFRKNTNDDIVIYTGYTPEEIPEEISILKQFQNIIIKFGRYKPNQASHYDELLGVNLASDNQYSVKIS